MLFKKASEKGNKEAHFNVALCYEEGIGTPPDIAKVYMMEDILTI